METTGRLWTVADALTWWGQKLPQRCGRVLGYVGFRAEVRGIQGFSDKGFKGTRSSPK